jgi:serine/threonine protein kinase
MKLSKDELITLSRLLDEAWELPAEGREAWLESLVEPLRALRPRLRELLARQASVETDDFLDTLPKFTLAADAAEQAQPAESVLEGQIVGPYRLLREIGRGGMSTVWLATRTDGLIGRPVALKLPHRNLHLRGQFAERFARERDILAALTHPNIARLYDAGISAEGQPYLAMEYVEGASLIEYCDSHRLTIRERVVVLLQVLAAIQYAHAHLVIHRDLKPSNILVTATGHVQLLDFGIAKLLTDGEAKETALTQIGGRALTPDYASPEQITGRPLSIASDVYSLGVVLFELLTGERPYRLKRRSRAALEDAILSDDAVRPSLVVKSRPQSEARSTAAKRLAAQLRGDLDTIVLKALKKEAGERYPTADAFKQDLDRFLAGYAVLARPDSGLYRLRKFLGRNRLAAASGATVLLALGVGVGAALWQASVAREQARIARNETRTSETVQAFMEDLFKANTVRQPNPAKARLTTARELLDAGTQKIDTGLHDAPAAKYRVLRTLAQMYNGLDLPKVATELGRQRVALARSLYGAGTPELVDALVDLGDTANSADSVEEAGKALGEAEQILDGARDFSSTARGRAEVQLAYQMSNIAPAQALEHVDRGIRILRNHPPSRDLLFGLFCKGNLSYDAYDLRSAKAAALDAVRVAALLKEQANGLLSQINSQLGSAQATLEELPGAEVSLRAGVDAARRYYGDDTLDTVESLRDLGKFLIATSRIGDGLRVLEPARSVANKIGTTDETSMIPALALETVARGLNQSGRIEEALDVIRAAVAMRHGREPVAWLDGPLAVRTAAGLTEIGHYREATELLHKADETLRQTGDPHAPLPNDFLSVQAELLLAQGHADEAAQSFAAYRTEVTESGAVSRSLLEKRVTGAEIALARNDAEKAIAQAGEVRALVTGSANRPYLGIWEARAALVEGEALLRRKRPSDALPLLQGANQLSSNLFDPQRSPFLAGVKVALANCLLDLGRTGQARTKADEARRIHATHPELGEHYVRPLRELEARLKYSVRPPRLSRIHG